MGVRVAEHMHAINGKLGQRFGIEQQRVFQIFASDTEAFHVHESLQEMLYNDIRTK